MKKSLAIVGVAGPSVAPAADSVSSRVEIMLRPWLGRWRIGDRVQRQDAKTPRFLAFRPVGRMAVGVGTPASVSSSWRLGGLALNAEVGMA